MATSIDEVTRATHGIPFMDGRQAMTLREHFRRHDIGDVLELGFAHGVSSCYIAAILRERGRGHLTTIDRRRALDRDPNIEQLAGSLDLSAWITPVFAHRSYTWGWCPGSVVAGSGGDRVRPRVGTPHIQDSEERAIPSPDRYRDRRSAAPLPGSG